MLLAILTCRGALGSWLKPASGLLCAAAAVLSNPSATAADLDLTRLPPPADSKVDFVKDIQPILSQHCYACHGEDKQEAELRWDLKQSALKGGEHGPAFIPGKSAESRLIHLVAELKPGEFMPKKGERLTREQISLLRGWIDQGAYWPEEPQNAGQKAPATKKDHWAFHAPVRPAAPAVKNTHWPRNAIDRFVLARLEKEHLSPAPEADRATLIRRLSLDLTGLPPTLREVDDFVADPSPEAYRDLVERLLA